MNTAWLRAAPIAATFMAAMLCGSALAQTASAGLPQGGDPRLPDTLKATVQPPSPRGEALKQVVQRKLRANFDAVDVGRSGRVTREQARSGARSERWSVLAEHFDEIDASGRGEVSFEDVMRYLERKKAERERAR